MVVCFICPHSLFLVLSFSHTHITHFSKRNDKKTEKHKALHEERRKQNMEIANILKTVHFANIIKSGKQSLVCSNLMANIW